jgi:hypothetical protein
MVQGSILPEGVFQLESEREIRRREERKAIAHRRRSRHATARQGFNSLSVFFSTADRILMLIDKEDGVPPL